jgi:hypothetical protein
LFNIINVYFFSLINLSCQCIALNLLVFVTIFFKSIIVWLHGFFPFSYHIFLKYFLQFELFSLLSLQNQVCCFWSDVVVMRSEMIEIWEDLAFVFDVFILVHVDIIWVVVVSFVNQL